MFLIMFFYCVFLIAFIYYIYSDLKESIKLLRIDFANEKYSRSFDVEV